MNANKLLPTIACLLCFSLTSCSNKKDSTEQIDSSKTSEIKICKEHLLHDEETLRCLECGTFFPHHYDENNKCLHCSKTSSFASRYINGSDITLECNEHGTIETVQYQTHAYGYESVNNRDDLSVTKNLVIYTPYGYSNSEKYDVLYLLHGRWENENYWFATNGNDSTSTTKYYRGYCTNNVLDNMIKQGLAKKAIVVCPSLYADSPVEGLIEPTMSDLINVFHFELVNDIMPFVNQNYATYVPATSTKEEMISNRDHVAYAGLSMGSMTSFASIFREALPYISYIGSYGAGAQTDQIIDDILSKINDGDFKDYKINYWMSSIGTNDSDNLKDTQLNSFNRLVHEANGKFKPGQDISKGENAEFMWIEGSAHMYDTWITSLYNSMRVFFK